MIFAQTSFHFEAKALYLHY